MHQRKINIYRNDHHSDKGIKIENYELRKHLSGKEVIKGETFLRGKTRSSLVEILRPLETIYRPKEMKNNKVCFQKVLL